MFEIDGPAIAYPTSKFRPHDDRMVILTPANVLRQLSEFSDEAFFSVSSMQVEI
jgi:hypothetical protein